MTQVTLAFDPVRSYQIFRGSRYTCFQYFSILALSIKQLQGTQDTQRKRHCPALCVHAFACMCIYVDMCLCLGVMYNNAVRCLKLSLIQSKMRWVFFYYW